MTKKNKTLIVIVGPTASGKTSLAVALAKKLRSEVISADSRQFFKHLNIGTAKPTAEEMDGVPHHFVDVLELDEKMSAGSYAEKVLALLNDLFNSKDQVILTGGSGLYVDAVCYGLDELPSCDPMIRGELNAIYEAEGIEPLLEELREKDPANYNKIERHNPHRVVRALEVVRASGRSISEFQKGVEQERPFNIGVFGIEQDREVLYDRINKRVEKMMEDGLLEEAKSLLPHRELNALNTVGYKELFAHLDGKCTLDEAVELIKRNTRRYAKRQMTWWRKNEEIRWVGPKDVDGIVSQLNRPE